MTAHSPELIQRIYELREEGHSQRLIGEQVGLTEQQVRRALKTRRRALMNREAVLGFIDYMTHYEPVTNTAKGRGNQSSGGMQRVKHIGGELPPDTTMRRLSDWRRGNQMDFFALDKILTQLSIHIDQFFQYCEDTGQDPWRDGRPEWHP